MNHPIKSDAEKLITDHNSKSTTTDNSNFRGGLIIWLQHHQTACKNAISRLISTPLSSLLTIFVVAIALSLPAALQVIIKNLESGQNTVNEQAKIALFLKKSTSEKDITALIQQLKSNDSLLDVVFISPDQALQEFQQSSNLGKTLNTLKNNPLPASIIITPDTRQMNIKDVELLILDFQELEAVDLAQIDVMWLKKLLSVIDLARHFAIGISLFLIFAVFILIGNTIRQLGQSFQEEIAISKLVGATDAYVRRIFLYSGLFYGLSGSIFGLIFVYTGIIWLLPKLNDLASLYGSNINISGLGITDILSLISIGMILGLGGAWVAANRIINRLSL